MNEHPRREPAPGTALDPLAERIARSLRSREPLQPDPAVVTAHLEAALAARDAAGPHRTAARVLASRGTRIAAAGVVTSTLAVAGAGAAAAAHPYSQMARTVEQVVQAVGIDWTAMPAGYTREQYDAFWDAGYTTQDLASLESLWSTDAIETKARVGQMLLDGHTPPVAPGGPAQPEEPTSDAPWSALGDAGYSYEDAQALGELWDVDVTEAKTRAARVLVDGGTLPVPPSGPGASGS